MNTEKKPRSGKASSAQDLLSVEQLAEMSARYQANPASPAGGEGSAALRQALEFSRAVNAILDVDELLHFLVQRFVHLLQAERGFLMTLDVKGKPQFRVCQTLEGAPIDRPQEQVSTGVIDEAVRSGRAVLVANAMEHPEFRERVSISRLELLSVLCAPMVGTRRGTVGVIYMDNRSTVGRFTEVDRDLLMLLANQAAIAMENARLFEELRAAQATIQKDQQMRLVGQVAWEVNRRFREVLASIAGQVQIANWTRAEGSMALAILHRIEEEARRGMSLFQETEALYLPVDPAGFRRWPLRGLIETCVTDITLARSVNFEMNIEPGVEVWGDRAALRRAFSEILENACEAIQDSPNRVIRIDAALEGEGVGVRIRDGGPGMSEEALAKATEAFYSTRGKLGLGLTLAETILLSHAAKMEIQSERGEGTVVKILFPAQGQAETEAAAPAGEPKALRANVLLVDNQIEVADLLARAIAGHGHRVRVATDFEQATKAVAESPWDLLVMDAGFPLAGLAEFIRAARAARPGMRVILLSTWTQGPGASAIEGVDLVATKPIQMRFLSQLIRKAMEHSSKTT
ncbi:MAG: GAF domain-containing protein [Planctomycetes bacterium]|nr:GAF domain-containing protein [Planctomycetota bacterium]